MNRFLLFLLFINGISPTFSQIQFIGFDRNTCSGPMTNTYSFTNYSNGGGGSGTLYGFTVFKNGIAVYGQSGTMGDGKSCVDLKFVNDSIGFIVTYSCNSSNTVWRTADYGQTWSLIGGGAPNYFGLYVINTETAYLVTQWDFPMQLYVAKCSANAAECNGTLIYDQTITSDIFKTHTIFNSDLCGIDTLDILVFNGEDTITYHINFFAASSSLSANLFIHPTKSIVFPNPVAHSFSFIHPLGMGSSVRLYTLNGAKIVSYNQMDFSTNVYSIEGIPDGMYYLEIEDKEGLAYFQSLVINGKK